MQHQRSRRAAATIVLLLLAWSSRAQAQSEPLFLRYVASPSPTFTTYVEGNRIQVSVPSNWRELPESNSVTFAPEGAYGNVSARHVFTHGVELGLVRNDAGNLRDTTAMLIRARVLAGRRAVRPFEYRDVLLASLPGVRVELWAASRATGEPEHIDVFTTVLPDDELLYVVAVTPRACALDYVGTFRRVVESIGILEATRERREVHGAPPRGGPPLLRPRR